MPRIDYSTPLSTLLPDLHRQAARALSAPGDWLTGAQRVDAWRQFRDARTNPLDVSRRDALSPAAVTGVHEASEHLSRSAVEVVHRVASDPGRLTRVWAAPLIAELGEEVYTELVGVASIASVLDCFAVALTGSVAPLPEPDPGEPARVRPQDVGDVGAWVAQTLERPKANVSRTLSLVPVTNQTWRMLVDSHYSRGAEFFESVWSRNLTRPQVELVAARTTVLNQCFY